MSSLSPVIQGLLVSLAPEYEISNDAIGYISKFAENILVQLANEAGKAANKGIISSAEVEKAIRKHFPSDWASSIVVDGSSQLEALQNEDKDTSLKQEISDFELIDDERGSDTKTEGKDIFLSADFIKSFLSSIITAQMTNEGCIFLSTCMESVLSTLIQQSCVTLQTVHQGQMTITTDAIVETVQRNPDLRHLSSGNNVTPVSDEKSIVNDASNDGDENWENKPKETEKKEEEEAEFEAVTTGDEEPTEVENFDQQEQEIGEQENVGEIVSPIIGEANSELGDKAAPVESESAPVSELSASLPLSEHIAAPAKSEPIPAKAEPQNLEVAKLVGEEETYEDEELQELEQFQDIQQELRSVALFKQPLADLYGKCCPYFEVTSFAIHMLSSIMEYFMRYIIFESSIIARRARTRMQHVHARAALRRLTHSQNLILTAISRAESGNLFNEILPQLSGCVCCCFEVVAGAVEQEAGFEAYISEIVLYTATRLLLVASAHARMTSSWIITSDDVSYAALQFISESSPIYKMVKNLKSNNSSMFTAGEGDIVLPRPSPRIRAAEMIYLTSIIKETPLQLDNQLLIVFLFLVSLSLHTICCVR